MRMKERKRIADLKVQFFLYSVVLPPILVEFLVTRREVSEVGESKL